MEKERTAEAERKVFVFDRPTRDMEEYRRLLDIASRLKPYGVVCVRVGDLAEKSRFDMPVGRSPWHEYGAAIPTLHRVFPHPKIEPYVPAEWVKKNRELLDRKAEIIEEYDMYAFYQGSDPFFLPGAFFRAYPHLRGPRVDHPRRSRRPEFTYCIDIEEGRELLRWMVEALKKAVPRLRVYQFNTNDVGSGLCWSNYLYTGENGPRRCQLRSMGDRLRDLFEAIHRGAVDGGGDVDVHFTHNLHRHEYDQVAPLLPPRTYVNANFRSCPEIVRTGHAATDPAMGVVDPYAVISAAERFRAPEVHTCFFDFRCGHGRAGDLLDTVESVVEIFEDCLKDPTDGLLSRLEKLKKLSARWAGEEEADRLMESFFSLNREVFPATRKYSPLSEGVSVRHITRPLVVKPDLLTEEEESYFLPHVFNVSEREARMDYVDVHGGRLNTDACKGDWFWDASLQAALSALKNTAGILEKAAENAPGEAFLRRMALGLRLYASFVLSSNNFFYGQVFRDRHAEELAAEEPFTPPKERSLMGAGDYTQWYEVATDELNNAEELLKLLKGGGEKLVVRAARPEDEDTFLLGPDLIGAIEKKIEIMLRRWDDVGRYVLSPSR